MKKRFMLTSPSQIKAFSDPRRMRLLEMLIAEPLTVQQAAARFGVGRHGLYHHMRTLERAGCVELVTTRKKRGTTEKYYRAVARTFQVDPELFGRLPGRDAAANAALEVVSGVLKSAWREIQDGMRAGAIRPGDRRLGVQTFRLRIRMSPEKMDDLKRKLHAWVRECARTSTRKGTLEYGFASVFYPVSPPAAS